MNFVHVERHRSTPVYKTTDKKSTMAHDPSIKDMEIKQEMDEITCGSSRQFVAQASTLATERYIIEEVIYNGLSTDIKRENDDKDPLEIKFIKQEETDKTPIVVNYAEDIEESETEFQMKAIDTNEPYDDLMEISKEEILEADEIPGIMATKSTVTEASNQSTGSTNEPFDESIAAKIAKGKLLLKKQKGQSKVWEVYSKIVERNGGEIKAFVSCNDCKKVLRYNNSSTSNLTKHKCYNLKTRKDGQAKVEIDETTKKIVTKLVTKWVIENCRPYNMVTDDGLHAVLQEFALIGAKHGGNVDIQKALPHPTLVERNIENLYSQYKIIIKREIECAKANGFGLTTNLWTDNYIKENCIALTMHFIKNGVLMTRLLGLKSMEGDKCTSENILRKVQKLLQDFGCELSSKSIVVTNGGCNMMKAFRNMQHLPCISHLLNNAVKKSIEAVNEVEELYLYSAKLVEYFKTPGLNANLSSSLKSFCPTRWNTVYDMLSSIKRNWKEINQFLQTRNELDKIEALNINYLKAVLKVLQPFEEASKTLEGQNVATLHLVLLYLHQLKAVCEPDARDLDIIRNLKEKLLIQLDSTVIPNTSIFHKLALFLFPPTNKLLQFTDSEKQSVDNECVRLLKCFENEIEVFRKETKPTEPLSKYRKLFADFVEPVTHSDINEIIRQELQSYKNIRVKNPIDFDVFKWWELQKNNLPLLYKLSCIILATPATCGSSERVFSSARNLLSERRSSLGLNEQSISQIMCMHYNKQQKDIATNRKDLGQQNKISKT